MRFTRRSARFTAVTTAALTMAGLLWILPPARPAFAQDDDPAMRAMREMEELRSRQAAQLHRAEVRMVSPLTGQGPAPRHGASDAVAPRPVEIEAPSDRRAGEGAAPWLLPALLVAGLLLVGWWKRPRGPRWSTLPGHQGLRARN